MDNIFIDKENVIDFKLNKISWNGEILAKYEFTNGSRELHLETNGEENNIYLEIVDYRISHDGTLLENSFSEPIYDIQSDKEIEELFQNWIEQD